jgi:protein Mpv17
VSSTLRELATKVDCLGIFVIEKCDINLLRSLKMICILTLNKPTFISYRYEGLEKFISHSLQLMPKTAQSVATKVAMDGLIFGPIHLFVFFTYMGLSAGKTIPQVKEDLKRNYFPALVLEGGVWPIVQIFNFRYVPVKYQLLYVNLFCLLDSAFLSWLEQQKDAPWKQWFQPFHSSNGRGGQ